MAAKTKTKFYEVAITFELSEEIVIFADDRTVKEKAQAKIEELVTIYDCNDYDVTVRIIDRHPHFDDIFQYLVETKIQTGDIISVEASSKKGAIAFAKEEFKERIEVDPEHGFDIDLCLSAEIQED